MDMVEALMRALSERTKDVVDLRCSRERDGRLHWCVRVGFGNRMTVVPYTVQDDPVTALQIAIERWDTRSPDRPFVSLPGYREELGRALDRD